MAGKKKKQDFTGADWDIVVAGLGKKFGKGLSLFQMDSEQANLLKVETIPTDLLGLDDALGVFGFPRGRIIEVYGQESSAKTSLALQAVVSAQKAFPERPILYVDLEHCLTGDSLVYDCEGGLYKTISEIINTGENFTSLGVTKDGRLQPSKAKIKNSGKQRVLEIKASRGRNIKVTANHKILTSTGYQRADAIKKGDVLYTPLFIPEEESLLMDRKEEGLYRLLGLHIGDGSRNLPDISNIDPEVERDIREIAAENKCKVRRTDTNLVISATEKLLGYQIEKDDLRELIDRDLFLSEIAEIYGCHISVINSRIKKFNLLSSWEARSRASLRKHRKSSVELPKRETLSKDSRNPITKFLNQFKCFSQYSKERNLPPGLSKRQLAQVLAGMYMADGTVVNSSKKHRCTISYSTESKILAYNLQAALQKFSLVSAIYEIDQKEYDPVYHVVVNGVSQGELFLESIPIYGEKRRKLKEATKSVRKINRIKREGNLVQLSVIDITEKPEEETYDISVDRSSDSERNFLANGLIVHNSLDPAWMKTCGVSFDNLWVSQPDSGEEATQIIITAAESGQPSLIVLDSIAAVIPQAEIDGEMTDQQMGKVGAIMGKFCRKVITPLQKGKTTLIGINQTRAKLGPFPGEERPGGKAYRFFATQILRLYKSGDIKQGDEVIGVWITVQLRKNKVAPPFKTATIPLLFSKGFSPKMSLIETASKEGIIDKSGSWYSYNGERLGQGVINACQDLDDETFDKIYAEFKSKKMAGSTVIEQEPDEE